MTLTAAIITSSLTLDPLLLSSLSFADEILLLYDGPAELSTQKRKIKTYHHPLNGDFAAQRNFALLKATSDWVLFVDSDEYVGSELAREIKVAIERPGFSGFKIPRLDVVFHDPLLHGETGRLCFLRLARRDAGKFIRPVHEVWNVSGRVGELREVLFHRKNNFISEFLGRVILYGPIDAKILTKEGKPFSWFRFFIYPLAKFKFNYFFKLGFLDGYPGLFLAFLLAVQSLSVRIFQWENQE